MRHTEFCKHYRAMSDHTTCEKGVAYDDFKGLKFGERPCFEHDGIAPPGCPLAEFPTAEERAEMDREIDARFKDTMTARQAIVAHLGGAWKKGTLGATGEIDCPVCKKGRLRFSRAGYNGHIHAGCTTDKCVQWME